MRLAKRALSVLLSVLLIISVFTVIPLSASAESVQVFARKWVKADLETGDYFSFTDLYQNFIICRGQTNFDETNFNIDDTNNVYNRTGDISLGNYNEIRLNSWNDGSGHLNYYTSNNTGGQGNGKIYLSTNGDNVNFNTDSVTWYAYTWETFTADHVAAEASTCEIGGNIEYYTAGSRYFKPIEGTTDGHQNVEQIAQEEINAPLAAHTLQHIDGVAAGCITAGMTEHYECTVCHKCFSDAAGETEVSSDSLTISALGHDLTHHAAVTPTYDAAADTYTDGNIEYWTCGVCGKYFSDAAGENEITQNDTVVPYFEYTITESDEVILHKYNGTDANVTIPETIPDDYYIGAYRGRTIVTIDAYSFRNNTYVTNVTIGDNIETIGYESFDHCSNLETVTIGTGLKNLYSYSFCNCPNLTSLTCYSEQEIEVYACPVVDSENVVIYVIHDSDLWDCIYGGEDAAVIGIDEHTYDVTFNWDGCACPTARIQCEKCDFDETVEAAVTSVADTDKTVYTATAEFDGETYTDTKTVYADGFGAALVGHSISLGGDIGVNFYMELDDTVAASETAYMLFTVPTGGDPDIQRVYVKDAEPKVINGNTYYGFKCHVAAKEMASEITAQLFDGENHSDEYSYSVKDYAYYLLENAYEADGVTVKNQVFADAVPLVKAMLNYGAAAQTYFDKNMNALVNADLSADDRALGEVTAAMINKPYDSSLTTLPSGVAFKSVTLSLKSETTLSLYFTSDSELTFSCDKGKTVQTDTVTSGGVTYKVARIRGIAANELGQDFTLTVSDGTDSGSVTYSPMTYCYNVLDRGTTEANLPNVVKALYWYWQAALPYFG